jgi:hypothetical protein
MGLMIGLNAVEKRNISSPVAESNPDYSVVQPAD